MELFSKLRRLLSGSHSEWRTREEYFKWKQQQATGGGRSPDVAAAVEPSAPTRAPRIPGRRKSPGPTHPLGELTESWVAIDFETSNARPSSACALGVAEVEGLEVVRANAWLIRPPLLRFNPRFVRIHGISAADVRNSPTFHELWPDLVSLIAGRTLVAHNAKFDLRVLAALFEHYEIAASPVRAYCTVDISRRAWPRLSNHRLNTVCNHLDIRLEHHDAESDARAAASIAIRAASHVECPNLMSLPDLLGLHPIALPAGVLQ